MNVALASLPLVEAPNGDFTGEGLERFSRNPNVSEPEKIAEASRQFEAILLRQILAAARKTVIRSDLERESAETGIYQDMVNVQLADAISRSGSLGLARSLQVQFARPPSSTVGTESVAEATVGAVRPRQFHRFPASHD